MARTVSCVVLNKEAEGLAAPPYPGALGKRIYQQVSAEAWKLWLRQQTRIINEYRLNASNPEHRKLLEREMENFFFGSGSQPPPDFTPPKI